MAEYPPYIDRFYSGYKNIKEDGKEGLFIFLESREKKEKFNGTITDFIACQTPKMLPEEACRNLIKNRFENTKFFIRYVSSSKDVVVCYFDINIDNYLNVKIEIELNLESVTNEGNKKIDTLQEQIIDLKNENEELSKRLSYLEKLLEKQQSIIDKLCIIDKSTK